MKLMCSHIALLPFVIMLLAGVDMPSLQSAQTDDDVQTLAFETNTIVHQADATGFNQALDQTKPSGVYLSQLINQVSRIAGNNDGDIIFGAKNSTAPQPFYQRFYLNWDQFKADNGMAKVPTASATQSLLLNISSVSPDEIGSSLLQNLSNNKFPAFFSCSRQLLAKPVFKKFALLPMVSSTAIGAP